MRKSMPVALIRASTVGSMMAGSGGGGVVADVGRQAVALIGVEDDKPLEEWNGLRFLARLARAPLFLRGHEAIGVDHRRAALALADMAAEGKRLAESEPA